MDHKLFQPLCRAYPDTRVKRGRSRLSARVLSSRHVGAVRAQRSRPARAHAAAMPLQLAQVADLGPVEYTDYHDGSEILGAEVRGAKVHPAGMFEMYRESEDDNELV